MAAYKMRLARLGAHRCTAATLCKVGAFSAVAQRRHSSQLEQLFHHSTYFVALRRQAPSKRTLTAMNRTTADHYSPLTQFRKEEKWLENGSRPILPVHIVDAPLSQSNRRVDLRQIECSSLGQLDDYLGRAESANYAFRFM